MTYKIEFASCAAKELTRIHRSNASIAGHIVNSINALADDPFRGKLLKGDFGGLYSLRVGMYRVIYLVDQGRIVIQVVRVGHRKDVYR